LLLIEMAGTGQTKPSVESVPADNEKANARTSLASPANANFARQSQEPGGKYPIY